MAILNIKKDNWIGNNFKEREVKKAIKEAIGDYETNLNNLLKLVKKQDEYQ
jgi:type I restriction enzyme R subunit